MDLVMPFALIAALVLAASSQSSVPTTLPASNTDEPNVQLGKRPYELDWANRTQPSHPQLVDFEDLTGWRVRCRNGARARLYRSQQEIIFGQYTAKVVYSGTSVRSTFVIEPPKPIEIPGRFTAVNLWVRGNNWGWVNPPATARTNVRVLVRDAKDEEYAIPLGQVNFDYWFLMHRTMVSPTGDKRLYDRTDAKFDETIDYPARFVGIEVSGCSDDRPVRMYFDALSFYEIQYKPLTFDPQPDNLPWPTTPDTILPTLERPVRNEIKAGDKHYDLTATGPTETIRYRYEPTTGLLSDVTVEAGGQRFHPCWDGGIEFELSGKPVRPGAKGVTTTLANVQADKERIVAQWRISDGKASAGYRYEFRIKGKSLIVDVTAEGGRATRLDVGLAKGLNEPKAIYFPYLTYGGDWPRVVCSAGKDGPVFLLALFDHYRSDASHLYGTPRRQGKDAIGYIGGAVYTPKTDGKRNDLRERLFVNVSRNVREVLPNIPNPKCDTGQIAREYLWRNIGSPQREMLTRYKAYGIDKFIACHHEVGWRDVGESFTMRLRAAPRIGDKGLAEYSKWLRRLGYRFGTYTNYIDFAPVNANWNEDDVCLNPDGTWQRAWPRCYALKPLRAVEKEAWYAPRIHEKFGTNAQYCDVHTAYSPWGRTDYDARTPGAGKFRTQFNAYARLLFNESNAHHGPVFSEGCYQWFYAGIVDGNYGQIIPHGQGWRIEPIVDFDLLKMHPLMTDFGMGMPSMYFGQRGGWTEDRSRLSPFFDQFHVSTIAFGHIGFLASEWGFDGTLKSYYLLQALQQRYTMVPVERIRYYDGKRLVDTSMALATDAYKRRQINVRYEDGLEVWCNLSPEHQWSVRVDGSDYQLPPYSFVAHRPNDILAYSAIVNGRRHELVRCSDYVYLDSRDHVVRTPTITARGAVAVKPDGAGAWWVILATTCEEVTVSTSWLGGGKRMAFAATAHDESGKQVCAGEIRRGSDAVTVMPVKGAIKYRLVARTPAGPGTDWAFDLPRRELIQGASMPVAVTIKPPAGTDPSSLELAAECVPSGGSPVSLGKTELAASGTARVELKLPPDQKPHARCWYRFRLVRSDASVVDERWIDVTAVPVFDLAIRPIDRPYQPGQAVTLTATVTTHRTEATDATVTLTAPQAWRAEPAKRTVRLDPKKPQTLTWQLHLPDEPVVGPLTIRVEHGQHASQITRYIKTQPTDWVAADLTQLPMTTGACIRGRGEQPLSSQVTGALVNVSEDRVGGERMSSIYMHPPYKTGVGYSFASIPVELPAGRPQLAFSLGFQEGSTSQDGCLFKVVVIDDDERREVFAKQYAVLNKWAHQTVDLSAFAGKRVTLQLITDVGPADNSYSDWACWGRPRVTLGDDVMAVEIHETQPAPAFLPPPEPLEGLTAADLSRIASAKITLEAAGVDGGRYTSYIYLNGVKVGSTPTPKVDIAWSPASVSVPPKAIKTIGRINRLVIKNPGQDCMKVRNVCLRFELDDGRGGTSWIDVGPYCSAKNWLHTEGKAVPVGADLPTVRLVIPLE